MTDKNITRQEVEDAIFEHLKAIKDIYLKYNPEGSYLSMFINAQSRYFHVNNASYDEDRKRPVDAAWTDNGENTIKHQFTAV